MKKKIKNITIVWENLEFGGMNSFIENLVNSKKFNNTNIFLITNKNNKGITSLKNNIKNKNLKLITYTSLNSLNLKPFDQSNFIGKFIKLFFILISPFLFLISILQFFFILKKNRTDLVLAACGGYGNFRSDSASLISAKILGYPKRILTIHHCYARVRLWEFFTKIIDIFVSKSSTSIIFVSKAVKKDIEKKTSLLKNIKISKIILCRV